MKALTLWQPWAWLVVNGLKDIENRTWKPGKRLQEGDRFLIHAGTRLDIDPKTGQSRKWPQLGFPATMPGPRTFVLGAIIGSVQYDGIVTDASETDSHWFAGPVGWKISHALEYASPIPCRGMLGLWQPDIEVSGECLDASAAAA